MIKDTTNNVQAKIKKTKIAVLGLALELYDRVMPESTARFQAQFQLFQAELAPMAEIGVSRLCLREDDVIAALAAAEADELDACLLIPLCYTASLMSVRALVRAKLPIVIWNTQETLTIGADYSFDTLRKNHVMQGTQDVTHVLTRSGQKFGMESGHYRDQTSLAKLGEWLAAARAARAAPRLRVGQLGAPFQDMGDFGVDTTRLAMQWGPHAIFISPARLVENIAKVTPAEIDAGIAYDRERFEISAGVTTPMHRVSAQLEIALRRLVQDERLDALTMNFLDLIADGRLPSLPFLGINKMMAEGLGYAGEGDILTATLMAQIHQMGFSSTFAEMFTTDYANNRVLMTHMQECNPALAHTARRIRMVPKPFWAPGIQPYVGLWFTLEPGPVTLASITINRNGEPGLLTYETTIFDQPPLEHLDIAHWSIQLKEPVGDFLTRYSMAGGPHHLVAVAGHKAQALRKLSYWLDLHYAQINID